MKRPKIVLAKQVLPRAFSPQVRWVYRVVAKNGRTLAISDQYYRDRHDALRGAKDLIKTCFIMAKQKKARIVDA